MIIRRDNIGTIRQHLVEFERFVESDIDRSQALTMKIMSGAHELPHPLRHILPATILVDNTHIGDPRRPPPAPDRDNVLLEAHMIRQHQTIRRYPADDGRPAQQINADPGPHERRKHG